MAIAPFEASKIKIARAKRHLDELETEIQSYFDRKPMALIVEKPAEFAHLGSHSWTVRIREPIPHNLSAAIGDVVHNLRTSLDLLACDLVRLAGRSTKGVYFPFCDNPNKLDHIIKERNFHRAGPEAVAHMKSLRPFKGGNLALRAVHDLDILDKHEALIPMASVGISPGAVVQFSEGGGLTNIPPIPSRVIDGQHLLVTIPIPGLSIGTELPAKFELILGLDAPFGGKLVINALRDLLESVQSALQLFVTWSDKSVTGSSPRGT